MNSVTTKIEHKPGKVESVILSDEQGNFVEGKTYKHYAPYLKNSEKIAPAERERLSMIISLCFEHEKNMLELVKAKGLPGVKLVQEHAGFKLETEYVAGNTLIHRLTATAITFRESRLLLETTLRCISIHHTAGVVLNDTHPANFLVSPQGTVLFCDYGNAFSKDFPFVSPPLATGNAPGKDYFSLEQDKAFKDDHEMHRKQGSAPYHPETLKSNRLGLKGDFYVLAKHLLDFCPDVFDKDLRKILERMKLGRYQTADTILRDLAATAPHGFVTPEIDTGTRPVSTDAYARRHKQWSLMPSWRIPRWLRAAAAGVCLAAGLGFAEMQSGFVHSIINETRSTALSVQPSSVVNHTGNAAVDRQMGSAPLPAAGQGNSAQLAAAASRQTPANTLSTAPKQLQTAKPAPKPSNITKPPSNEILEKSKIDAFSADTAVALRGIATLQQLTTSKSPAAGQALDILGKLITDLEDAAPSEPGKRRLELLCSYGHTRAHFIFARWLEDGKGIKGGRDLSAAYRHYAQASRKIAKASSAMEQLEKVAEGIIRNPPNQNELFRLLLTIAEQPENSQAQAAVGIIYAEGRYGQPRNKELATQYLRRSLHNGFADAKQVMRKHGIQG